MTVTTLAQMFEDMLGCINYDMNSEIGKLYPFKVRVGCIKRRPPRHKFFVHILDMGMLDIDKVFNKKSFNKKKLTFVFPERWLGIVEQQSFMFNLNKHPDNLEQVDILTSSPLLISDFMREHIRIIIWEDDD